MTGVIRKVMNDLDFKQPSNLKSLFVTTLHKSEHTFFQMVAYKQIHITR